MEANKLRIADLLHGADYNPEQWLDRPDILARDIELMKEAAKVLLGKHDFKAFSDNKRMKKSTVRDIYSIDIYGDNNEVIITIHGDDFWPNMVRIIVGTLIEIGRGDREVSTIKNILESKDRSLAGDTAPAQGLFLQEVLY